MKLMLNTEFNLYENNGQAFCDSLQIAETFEKQHAHVLRDIEKILEVFAKIGESKFGLTNFIKSTYKSMQNKKLPMYLLKKDGFTYLTMGYDGERAAAFKIAYINRFNQMENLIKTHLSQREIHPALMDAIKEAHEEPKHYHYSNEQNMIYKIVLGMDAKTYRQTNNISSGTAIKPYLNLEQIEAIETLQRIDVGLHEAGLNYEERKQILQNKFSKTKLMLTA